MALVISSGLTAALVDFRGIIPVPVGHWLASFQFVPSSVALTTGAALSLACLVIVGTTLAFGRVYCSTICPLGVLQDVVARVAGWIGGRGSRFPYARPQTWLRQLVLWGAVAGLAADWTGFTLSLIDPYSNFGRIASDIFRPLAALANNALVGLFHAVGIHAIYRVEPPWAAAAALCQPALLMILIIVMVALRGRLYCSTLCPVGTLLGLFSRRAAFRLGIDRAACRKCGDCLRVCKAQCIDLRTTAIDFSRCVACYNCIGACPDHGIRYHYVWARPAPMGRAAARSAAPADLPRRAFVAQLATASTSLLGVASLAALERQDSPANGARRNGERSDEPEPSRAICPPGAVSVDRFMDRCTACHLCISACPTHVLQPALAEYGFAGLMLPRLDFTRAACSYTCRICAEVCPDGAIQRLDLADKQLTRIGEAHLDEDKCIVKTKGTDCAACSEQCPTQAVTMVPHDGHLRFPQLNRDLCIGCGGCEFACPVQPQKAISVTGYRRHGRAKKALEKKAALPAPTGDFPF